MIVTLVIFSGVMAGIYFSFSVFMMKSLDTLQPLTGARVMIAINATIVKTLFLPLFFSSTLLFTVVIVTTLLRGFSAAAFLSIAAAVIYVFGMFVVTVVGNVPMNNRLASLAGEPQALAHYWQQYRLNWTRLNHVRTLACLLATLLLSIALQSQ